MMEGSLYDDHSAIHDQSEINCPKAHQVGTHAKNIHHRYGKQHGKWNCRSNNESCPQVSEEKHQHENNDQRTLNQVLLHGADSPADQVGAIQIRFDEDIIRQ
ncbi:hypothetical protein D9M68_662570 [compost metagenome]